MCANSLHYLGLQNAVFELNFIINKYEILQSKRRGEPPYSSILTQTDGQRKNMQI